MVCDKVRVDKHESVMKSLGPCCCSLSVDIRLAVMASVVSGTVVRCMRHVCMPLLWHDMKGVVQSVPPLFSLHSSLKKSSLLFGLDRIGTQIHCCCFISPTLTKPWINSLLPLLCFALLCLLSCTTVLCVLLPLHQSHHTWSRWCITYYPCLLAWNYMQY